MLKYLNSHADWLASQGLNIYRMRSLVIVKEKLATVRG